MVTLIAEWLLVPAHKITYSGIYSTLDFKLDDEDSVIMYFQNAFAQTKVDPVRFNNMENAYRVVRFNSVCIFDWLNIYKFWSHGITLYMDLDS